jgi:L-amino acid N-acyltransferase YncA
MKFAPPIIACGERHLPAILQILNEAIVNTTALYDYQPRTPAMIEDWFERKKKGNYPLLGIESEDGELAGFATYGPFRAFPGYKYTVEHSVYVERSHRGKGIGKTLMIALIAAAQEQEYHVVLGAIDASNTESIQFHRALGFTPCGTIKQAGYKFGRWLDVEFYQRILRTPVSPADG